MNVAGALHYSQGGGGGYPGGPQGGSIQGGGASASYFRRGSSYPGGRAGDGAGGPPGGGSQGLEGGYPGWGARGSIGHPGGSLASGHGMPSVSVGGSLIAPMPDFTWRPIGGFEGYGSLEISHYLGAPCQILPGAHRCAWGLVFDKGID